MPRKRPPAHTVTALREVLNGATLRKIIDYQDMGEVTLAYAGSDFGLHEPHDKRHDVWMHITDCLTEMPYLGRLFIPAGVLFRLPKKGETAVVLQPKDMRGSGGFLVLPDGSDGNTQDYLPEWLDEENCGVYATDEAVHVESKNKDVIINAGGAEIRITKDGEIRIDAKAGQKVKIQGGGQGVARKDDEVKCYIPKDTVVIAVAAGAGKMNDAPIECVGSITGASAKAEIG